MFKKRLFILSFLLIGVLALSACGTAPADDGAADARVAELEAALAAAESAGGSTVEELAAMQAELEALTGDLADAKSESACTYSTYRMGWIMDWADAGNMVDTVFGTASPLQYTFWAESYPDEAATFSGLVADAYVNTDLESRAAQWQAAEKIIVEDLATVIPLYHYDYTTMINTDFNVVMPPFGSPRMADWSSNSGATTIRWRVATAIPTLDIQKATDTTSHYVLAQLIDHPYKFNPDSTISPLSATGFDVSEDGTVFTVYLREDAMWSDGEPVTAQHFVDGITRLLNPELANEYGYVMDALVGYDEFTSGDTDTLDSVVALDDYTFQFTLKEPRSYFDSLLAFFTFDPVRLDVIEANPDTWTQPGVFVSNGAYVMVEHNPGENLVLEKNEFFWDADNVTIERIEVAIIDEDATALAAFEAGELDYANQLPFEDIPRISGFPEFARLPRPGTYYMGVNTTGEHTSNVTFRKALAKAIDKDTIVNNVLEQPWKIPAFGVIPPEIFGYAGETVGFPYDPEGAVALLEEYMAGAGIEDAGDIVVELWYNKGNEDVLDAVQAMWEETLGLDVRIVTIEWASYLDILDECNN